MQYKRRSPQAKGPRSHEWIMASVPAGRDAVQVFFGRNGTAIMEECGWFQVLEAHVVPDQGARLAPCQAPKSFVEQALHAVEMVSHEVTREDYPEWFLPLPSAKDRKGRGQATQARIAAGIQAARDLLKDRGHVELPEELRRIWGSRVVKLKDVEFSPKPSSTCYSWESQLVWSWVILADPKMLDSAKTAGFYFPEAFPDLRKVGGKVFAGEKEVPLPMQKRRPLVGLSASGAFGVVEVPGGGYRFVRCEGNLVEKDITAKKLFWTGDDEEVVSFSRLEGVGAWWELGSSVWELFLLGGLTFPGWEASWPKLSALFPGVAGGDYLSYLEAAAEFEGSLGVDMRLPEDTALDRASQFESGKLESLPVGPLDLRCKGGAYIITDQKGENPVMTSPDLAGLLAVIAMDKATPDSHRTNCFEVLLPLSTEEVDWAGLSNELVLQFDELKERAEAKLESALARQA